MEHGLLWADRRRPLPQARRQLRCSICKQAYGACIQCSGHKNCFTAFHPLCARSAGLVMDSVHDETFSPEDSPLEVVATLPQVDRAASGPAPEAKRRRRGSWYEGTAVGDGTKLVSIPASWVATVCALAAQSAPCCSVHMNVCSEFSLFSASRAALPLPQVQQLPSGVLLSPPPAAAAATKHTCRRTGWQAKPSRRR